MLTLSWLNVVWTLPFHFTYALKVFQKIAKQIWHELLVIHFFTRNWWRRRRNGERIWEVKELGSNFCELAHFRTLYRPWRFIKPRLRPEDRPHAKSYQFPQNHELRKEICWGFEKKKKGSLLVLCCRKNIRIIYLPEGVWFSSSKVFFHSRAFC